MLAARRGLAVVVLARVSWRGDRQSSNEAEREDDVGRRSAVRPGRRTRRTTTRSAHVDEVDGGAIKDFRSRLKRRSVRFGADARRSEAAAAECAERQSFPYGGARGEAAASQRLSTRRSSAHQALSGGEPGGPASVLGRYAPGDTGNPLRDGGTFVLGCPIGETVDNQGRARLASLAADAKEAAHDGAPQTARKDEEIGATCSRLGAGSLSSCWLE